MATFGTRALLCALLAMPATAAAQAAGGSLDFYYIPSADIELEVPGFGTFTDDGSGFGLKGTIPVDPQVVLTGEFQSTRYHDFNSEVSQHRFGVGFTGPTGPGAFVEYIRVDTQEITGSKTDGLGLHLRLSGGGPGGVSAYGQVGYLLLRDDFEDIRGVELAFGARVPVSSRVGFFVDLRKSPQKGVDSDIAVELTDLRLGLSVAFGH